MSTEKGISITYDHLQIGQKASLCRTVEERELQLFAVASGDSNPVHLDAEFAAKTLFKQRIAHGMFSGALISAALACQLPGPGTVYLEQTLSFRRPVFIDDEITVELEVIEKLPKNRVRIKTTVTNQNGKIVTTGEALVLAPLLNEEVEFADLPHVTID